MPVYVLKKQDTLNPEKEKPTPICNCAQDLYVDLPPELQPEKKSWKSGFRHVTCPSCGLEYWTNREGDLCTNCQKKGTRNPKAEKSK